MAAQKQNPGGKAGASQEVIYRLCSQLPHTAANRRAQILAARFHMSIWMASEVARLCFGEEFCVQIRQLNEDDFLVAWPVKAPDTLTCLQVGQTVTETAIDYANLIGEPVWEPAA